MRTRIKKGGKVFLDGRPIGNIEGDTYTTYRGQKTFFRKHNGYGVTVEVLETLERNGVKKVRVEYEGARGKQWPIVVSLDYLMKQPTVRVPGWDDQKIVRVRT